MMVCPRNEAPGEERGVARSLRLELQREMEAPSVARAAVSGLCHDLDLDPSQCHALMLLVSEVVSNAVLHSEGPADAPIVLSATVARKVVRIAVTDAGHWPRPPARGDTPVGPGYGLYLVEKAATNWGVDHQGGTRVWFELARA
jgi:anti-sigma regulatory factor (Ser/Thr protein kinase)